MMMMMMAMALVIEVRYSDACLEVRLNVDAVIGTVILSISTFPI